MLSITAGLDPCDILTTAIIGDKANLAYTTSGANSIVSSTLGTLTTFVESMTTALMSSNVLTAPNSSSEYRLIKYLSGGYDSQLKTLGSIVLGTSASPEGIVDTYIVRSIKGLGKTNYKYTFQGGTGDKTPLTDPEIKTIRNRLLGVDTNLTPVATNTNPVLLRGNELYVQSQLTGTAPNTGNESLLYLIKLSESTTELGASTSLTRTTTVNGVTTEGQVERKQRLETKNLKFFSAFLVEYCFYRTRYTKMLEHYFTAFNTSTTSYTASTISNIANLFGGTSEPATRGTGTTLQSSDLQVLTYHMACLKTRMTDMIRLLNSINEYYNEIFTQIQSAINDGTIKGSSAAVNSAIVALQVSNEESKKYLTEAQFRQGAMDYTQEKNRHANVLLGLYAFLNLTALAIIFRVANS